MVFIALSAYIFSILRFAIAIKLVTNFILHSRQGRSKAVAREAVADRGQFHNSIYEQLYYSVLSSFSVLELGQIFFWQKEYWQKRAHKMLVKWTEGRIRMTLLH